MKLKLPCLAAVLAVLTFAGCSKKEDAAPATGGASSKATATTAADLPQPPCVYPCEPGVRGGRLVIATFGDPKTFNPITENEGTSREIIRFLFASLITLDWPTQTASPGLAHAWSVADDKRTWTWKLRTGLKWSDGHALTADDVVFTWNQIIYNPDIVNVTRDLFTIDGKEFKVSKVDDLTVQVVTPDAYAPFVEYFGGVETHGSQIVLRTQAATRDGFYFLVRTAANAAQATVRFEVEVARPDSPEPRRHTFNSRLPAGETVFQLGLTGPDWPGGKRAQPVAWRITLRGADNAVLAEHKSFLWEQPAKQ
mgnify:CR=1 FL=1